MDDKQKQTPAGEASSHNINRQQHQEEKHEHAVTGATQACGSGGGDVSNGGSALHAGADEASNASSPSSPSQPEKPVGPLAPILGMIIRDRQRDARLDALMAILSFLTPGEVQAFLEAAIDRDEWDLFRGLRHEVMQQHVEGVMSVDEGRQHQALTQLRRLVCKLENNAFEAQALIDSGLLPRLVELMQHKDAPQLQLEAAWVMTNLTSGASAHTDEVVRHDAVPALLLLLNSSSAQVRDQAVWALGNIAGDCPRSRDVVLMHGALPLLLRAITPGAQVSSVRIAVWALCNLCVRKNVGDLLREDWGDVNAVLSRLGWVLRHVEDKEAVSDASWALRHLLSRPDRQDMCERFAATGVSEGLLRIMAASASSGLRRHAELIVSKLSLGDATQPHTRAFLPKALNLLSGKTRHRLSRVQQYAAWGLGCLAAGDEHHRMLHKALPRLLDMLVPEPSEELDDDSRADVECIVAAEACYALVRVLDGACTRLAARTPPTHASTPTPTQHHSNPHDHNAHDDGAGNDTDSDDSFVSVASFEASPAGPSEPSLPLGQVFKAVTHTLNRAATEHTANQAEHRMSRLHVHDNNAHDNEDDKRDPPQPHGDAEGDAMGDGSDGIPAMTWCAVACVAPLIRLSALQSTTTHHSHHTHAHAINTATACKVSLLKALGKLQGTCSDADGSGSMGLRVARAVRMVEGWTPRDDEGEVPQ